jgi:hypothetical protein
MDKRIDGLAGAMREIAEQRDNQLRNAEEISPDRLEQLRACLAGELPVETGLLAAAKRRDESLRWEPVLPAMVRAALVEQTRSVRKEAKPFNVLRQLSAWVSATSLSGAYRTAAALAAAIVVTLAILQLSRSRDAATQTSIALAPNSIPADFFSDATPLTLRVSRLELASLDRSLLTINRAFPKFEQQNQPLPLDLPIRPIRLDVDAVRMP